MEEKEYHNNSLRNKIISPRPRPSAYFFLSPFNEAVGSTPKVPEDHVFAYPPTSSSVAGGDSGKMQDIGDAAIFPSPMRAPFGNDFFYATRRHAEPPLNSPSPGAPTASQAAAAVGAVGAAGAAAAAAATRAGAGSSAERPVGATTSGRWPQALAGSASGEWSSSSSAHVGGGVGGGDSRPSSSTVSALSAGSMETKHDVGGEARASPMSPASRASGSCAPSATVGGAAATAAATAQVVATTAGTEARERSEDEPNIEVRLLTPHLVR